MPPLPRLSSADPAALGGPGEQPILEVDIAPGGHRPPASEAQLAGARTLLRAVLNVNFFAQLGRSYPAGIGDVGQLSGDVRAWLVGAHPELEAARVDRLLPTLVGAVAQAYRHHLHDLALLRRQRARVEMLLPLHLEGYVHARAARLARRAADMMG